MFKANDKQIFSKQDEIDELQKMKEMGLFDRTKPKSR
jgi:hypothetical protein